MIASQRLCSTYEMEVWSLFYINCLFLILEVMFCNWYKISSFRTGFGSLLEFRSICQQDFLLPLAWIWFGSSFVPLRVQSMPLQFVKSENLCLFRHSALAFLVTLNYFLQWQGFLKNKTYFKTWCRFFAGIFGTGAFSTIFGWFKCCSNTSLWLNPCLFCSAFQREKLSLM